MLLWACGKKKKIIKPNCPFTPKLSLKLPTPSQKNCSQWGCDSFCSRVSMLMEKQRALFQKGSAVYFWKKEGVTNNSHFSWQGERRAGSRGCVWNEQFSCRSRAPELLLRGWSTRVALLSTSWHPSMGGWAVGFLGRGSCCFVR